jgi:hypothetical protein
MARRSGVAGALVEQAGVSPAAGTGSAGLGGGRAVVPRIASGQVM